MIKAAFSGAQEGLGAGLIITFDLDHHVGATFGAAVVAETPRLPRMGSRTTLAGVVTTRKPAAGVASGGNWKLIAGVAATGVTVAVADQVTKYWATSALAGREPVAVIGELIQFRVIHNAGAAFSIASGLTWLLTALVIVVLVVTVRVTARTGSRAWSVALGLVLGGGVGNLIDRLVRPPGFLEGRVVDFIDYGGWFVGNVADIAITVAVVLIGVLTIRGVRLDGTRRSDPRLPGS